MNRVFVSACCLLILFALAVPALAQDNEPAWPVVVKVRDDGNNLREFGGENYKDAPIIHVINQDEWLHVWNWEGNWAQVDTAEGLPGFIHKACLDSADRSGPAQDLDPALRQKLERFLKQLSMAVQSGNFGVLELLLHPHGVVVNGYLMADAATVPAKQAGLVMPLWYATDVSLTYGTPWELLMTGTNPQDVKVGWDSATDTFRVFGDDMKPEDYVDQAYPQEGLLPSHLGAMRLAPDARFVQGWPDQVPGYPMPEEPRDDYDTAPFALVYQTGPNGLRLEQADHVGFVMYLEEYEGILRLRGLMTQAW